MLLGGRGKARMIVFVIITVSFCSQHDAERGGGQKVLKKSNDVIDRTFPYAFLGFYPPSNPLMKLKRTKDLIEYWQFLTHHIPPLSVTQYENVPQVIKIKTNSEKTMFFTHQTLNSKKFNICLVKTPWHSKAFNETFNKFVNNEYNSFEKLFCL